MMYGHARVSTDGQMLDVPPSRPSHVRPRLAQSNGNEAARQLTMGEAVASAKSGNVVQPRCGIGGFNGTFKAAGLVDRHRFDWVYHYQHRAHNRREGHRIRGNQLVGNLGVCPDNFGNLVSRPSSVRLNVDQPRASHTRPALSVATTAVGVRSSPSAEPSACHASAPTARPQLRAACKICIHPRPWSQSPTAHRGAAPD